MATITEDYVSFEIAKLLKEKECNVICRAGYTSYGLLNDIEVKEYLTNATCPDTYWECTAPTHQIVMKWLRQYHKINIVIMPVVTDDDGEGGYLYEYIIFKTTKVIYESKHLYECYNTACDDALKYVLENVI